jgi:hypothetical protein
MSKRLNPVKHAKRNRARVSARKRDGWSCDVIV